MLSDRDRSADTSGDLASSTTLSRGIQLLHDHAPVVGSCVYGATAALTFWGLSQGGVLHTPENLGMNNEWAAYKAIAALSLALGVALFVAGVSVAFRSSKSQDISTSGSTVLTYCLIAAIVCGCLAALFVTQNDMVAGRTWPISGIDVKFNMVTVIITMCTAPWIALTWVAHKLVRETTTHTVKTLFTIWQLLLQCAEAYTLFIVMQLVSAGALRRVWLAQSPVDGDQRERLVADFPSSDVLLYGALGAVLGLLLFVPLVVGWRVAAARCVDTHYDLRRAEPPEAEWVGGRERLHKLLHLNEGILRSPLLLLSVLTPLITSVLAVFLPELVT
jgi:hypothetical protein